MVYRLTLLITLSVATIRISISIASFSDEAIFHVPQEIDKKFIGRLWDGLVIRPKVFFSSVIHLDRLLVPLQCNPRSTQSNDATAIPEWL